MTIRFSILGEPELTVGGRSVDLLTRRQRTVAAMLAVFRGRGTTFDEIEAALWPGTPPLTSRKTIHGVVHGLRKAIDAQTLGVDVVRSTPGGYELGPEVDTDELEWSERLATARSRAADGALHEALRAFDDAQSLWRGAALGSLSGDEWALEHARRLDGLHLEAAEERIALCIRLGHSAPVLAELDELAAAHRDRASLLELRARAYYACGRHDEALEACRRARVTHAGTPSDDRLRTLEQQLLSHDAALDCGSGGVRQLPGLPWAKFDILGREHEIARSLELLEQNRLLTISGTGGAGKSRLAIEVARRLASIDVELAWVDVGLHRGDDALEAAFVRAFGLIGGDGTPVAALTQILGARKVLVVLDTMEHVLDDVGIVDELLEGCPNVRVLATSRASLRSVHELVYAISPLDTALDPERCETIDLVSVPAIQLFLERAAAAGGGVDAHDPDVVIDVARICAEVDGLPLGIELAAARTYLLRTKEIRDLLHRRFDLLRTSDRSVPERQRSLASVVEWSYDLLDHDAQYLLCALSRFVGGANLDALQEVVGRFTTQRMQEILHQLERNCLVVRGADASGNLRWSLLDTIREFAEYKLVDHFPSRATRLQADFAHHMLGVAIRSNTHVGDMEATTGELIVELVNVVSAVEWATTHDPLLAADIFGSLRRYYLTRGSMIEAERLSGRILASLESPGRLRARAASLAGAVYHFRGKSDEAVAAFTESIEYFAGSGDPLSEAWARVAWADELRFYGAVGEAIDQCRIAQSLLLGTGDTWLLGWAMAGEAFALTDDNRWQEAKLLYHQARANFECVGDDFWVTVLDGNIAIQCLLNDKEPGMLDVLERSARTLVDGGYLSFAGRTSALHLRGLMELEAWEEACAIADDVVSLVRASGQPLALLYVLACESIARLYNGDASRASRVALEAIEIASGSGKSVFVIYPLYVIGETMYVLGEQSAASCALSEIDTDELWESIPLEAQISRRVPDLRIALGPDAEFDRMRPLADEVRLAHIARLVRSVIDQEALVSDQLDSTSFLPSV